jgi:hypothetical protein
MNSPVITLDHGVESIPVADIPGLVAEALHPDLGAAQGVIGAFKNDPKAGTQSEYAGGAISAKEWPEILKAAGCRLRRPKFHMREGAWEGFIAALTKAPVPPAYDIQPLFEDPNSAIQYRREVAARDLETEIKQTPASSGLRVRDPLTRSIAKARANDGIVLLQDFVDFCRGRGIEVKVRTAAQQRVLNRETDSRPVAEIAVEIATELDRKDQAAGVRSELSGIAVRVAAELKSRGIINQRNRPYDAATVQRDFLQAEKWNLHRPQAR